MVLGIGQAERKLKKKNATMRKYRNCGVEDCKVAKSKDIAMLRS